MKPSCSANVALTRAPHDARMKERGPADDLLDVVRALLLLQGAILIATTIEAIIWGVLFSGTVGAPALMSAAAAAVVLLARLRVRPDRRRTRRLVYLVECAILATFVIDAVLAVALPHALPPPAAVFTGCVLPLSAVLLLRRSTRAARTAMSPAVAAPEAAR
jgi:hypothetical protein